MQVGSTLTVEKPQNGVAGLKHWRHDMIAGLVVSLVSLPFSLGIAVASGAPPICGLISAIIAGLVLPFLGGSYVTISGPAAGLAPALFAAMLLLGRGDQTVGYPLLLVAITLTGVVQIVLAKLKLARFSAIFPAAVVEGMLASIGLLIIAKQLPLIFGSPHNRFEAHEFWGIVFETPSQFLRMDPKVFFLGIFSLALIFVLASFKARWLRVVAPPELAAGVGLILGWLLGLRGEQLILIPDHPFEHGIVWPNFYGMFSDHTLWGALATTVLTLTLIDGVESLATIAAIDKIDPFRRRSDPNKTLCAMGISNLCSSLAGGLTIIPGGVKSTTGILSGARTQWANFYNACCLIIYLLLARPVINLMPMSVLGAIVLYTGYKLCAPKVWRHVAHIGTEQLLVFTTTVCVTVSTDLLWGIAAGIAAKLLLEVAIVTRAERGSPERREPLAQAVRRWMGGTGELFRSPVVKTVTVDQTHHVFFGRPMVCFNSMQLDAALMQIPGGVSMVYLHVTELVTLIDHTSAAALHDFVENFKLNGRGIAEIVGLDRLRARSRNAASMRISTPVLAKERAAALDALARFSLVHTSSEKPDPFVLLERISLTRIDVNVDQDEHPVHEGVAHARRFLVRMAKAVGRWIRSLFVFNDAGTVTFFDHDLAWTSLSRVEQEDAPDEVEKLSLTSHPDADPKAGESSRSDPRFM